MEEKFTVKNALYNEISSYYKKVEETKERKMYNIFVKRGTI